MRYPALLKSAIKRLFVGLLLSAVLMPHATAHLMVAQQGTINIFKDGAYMVLSLPVSAFDGVDDNKDGKLSITEFTQHRLAIIAKVKEEVKLFDKQGVRPLEGMMLSPVTPHDDPKAPTDQLIVMGRFVLADANSYNDLQLHVGLFGKQAEEQSLNIIATRPVPPKKHAMTLTPKQSKAWLFRRMAER